MEPKNQVIWTTRCKIYGQAYVSIYFSKSLYTFVYIEVHQKHKLFCEGFSLDYLWPSVGMFGNAGTHSKKILSENIVFLAVQDSSIGDLVTQSVSQ